MNELFFYVGMVLSIVFFALTVFLFIHNKIVDVFKYYINNGNKKKFEEGRKGYSVKINEKGIEHRDEGTEILNNSQKNNSSYDNTEILASINNENKDEGTEILDIAKNYAEALAFADESTTLLPDLEEK